MTECGLFFKLHTSFFKTRVSNSLGYTGHTELILRPDWTHRTVPLIKSNRWARPSLLAIHAPGLALALHAVFHVCHRTGPGPAYSIQHAPDWPHTPRAVCRARAGASAHCVQHAGQSGALTAYSIWDQFDIYGQHCRLGDRGPWV